MKPLWLITALAGFVSTSVLAAPIAVKFDKVADDFMHGLNAPF